MSASSERIIVAVGRTLSPRAMNRIRALDDRVVLQVIQGEPPADDTEVAFGWPDGFPGGLLGFVHQHPRLRWVQSLARDAAQEARDVQAQTHGRVIVTGTAEADAGPLAEFAMAGILTVAKRLSRSSADSRDPGRRTRPVAELAGATLLVVGLGPVGARVAQLGSAFGMHVHGVNRDGRGRVACVESIRPPRFLGDLLPVSHAVVLALPRTGATRGMIGAPQIARMRRDAILVDISGGGVVEEQALQNGLDQGQPAAAVFDAFALGPLFRGARPAERANVLVGENTTGPDERRIERIAASFTDNLRRYLRGDALHGLLR